jgi:hypothetical protein
MNGAATRSRAATSPVANEPATIQPRGPRGPGSGRDGRSWPLSLGVGVVGVVVTIDSIPCTAGVARVQPSALGARADISTLGHRVLFGRRSRRTTPPSTPPSAPSVISNRSVITVKSGRPLQAVTTSPACRQVGPNQTVRTTKMRRSGAAESSRHAGANSGCHGLNPHHRHAGIDDGRGTGQTLDPKRPTRICGGVPSTECSLAAADGSPDSPPSASTAEGSAK